MAIVSAKKFSDPGPLEGVIELVFLPSTVTGTGDDDRRATKSAWISASQSGAPRLLPGVSSDELERAATIAHFFPVGAPCRVLQLLQCLVVGIGVSGRRLLPRDLLPAILIRMSGLPMHVVYLCRFNEKNNLCLIRSFEFTIEMFFKLMQNIVYENLIRNI